MKLLELNNEWRRNRVGSLKLSWDLPESTRIEITRNNKEEWRSKTGYPFNPETIIYVNDENELHNEYGPAIEYSNGTKKWFINGEFHNEYGPAIEYSNGTKKWFINGELHRDDGPAIEYPNGNKMWYINGKCHREDGPAIERSNGDKYWYINDKSVSERQYNEWRRNRVGSLKLSWDLPLTARIEITRAKQ